MGKDEIIFETCKLLVRHFRNLIDHNGFGFHTRIFSHMLHPEKEFIFIGSSPESLSENDIYPEHVVPCAVLLRECRRMILENQPDSYIAELLQKHWKLAHITKKQAQRLDINLRLKNIMPSGWTFETGNSLARLEAANIKLIR